MAGRTLSILCAGAEGDAVQQHSVAGLLPHAFGPANLGITSGFARAAVESRDA